MTASPETETDKPQASENNQTAEKPRTFGKPAGPMKSSASWSKDFFPGFGSKGPGSRPTWDLRPKRMREPDSKGTVVCSSCNGTGLMTCSFCEGVTFKAMDGTVVPCPACGNKKTVTCSACFGTGKQIELVSFLLPSRKVLSPSLLQMFQPGPYSISTLTTIAIVNLLQTDNWWERGIAALFNDEK